MIEMNALLLRETELEKFIRAFEEDLKNIKRVVEFLEKNSAEYVFVIHENTKSVRDSSEKLGISRKEIVKTIVFSGKRPAVVLVQGHKSVDIAKLSGIMEAEIRLASAEEVVRITGFKVGGVSPFGMPSHLKIIMDRPILDMRVVRPAAGSECAGVIIKPEELKRIIKAEVKDIS